MKKICKIIASSVLLIGCLLMTSCDAEGFLSDSISIKYTPKDTASIDTSAPDDTSSPDVSPPDTSTPDTSTPDTSASDDTSAPEEENYAYQLTSAHDVVYVTNGKECRVGVIVEGLKPNTKYRINWFINQGFLMNTSAYFVWYDDNGTMRPCVYWNSSYTAYDGLGTIFHSTDGSIGVLLNGNDGYGIEVSTEGEDDTCVFFLFGCAYESADQMAQLCKDIFPYITKLTFTEITE